jgi:hypothetical protein
MKKIEKTLVAKGDSGRLGTWAWSTGYTMVAGLGELGKRVVEGTAKLSSTKDIYAALGKYTPGARWNGAYYTDMSTGVRSKNELLVYMDTYIFGKGFIGTTAQKVPDKYFTIKR